MDYLKWGGFPLRFDYSEEFAVHKYLTNLYESIVNRDIVGKTKSADKKAFMDISLYILANVGKELSIENIIATYKENNKDISKRTVYNYLERMKKAYLIHGVGRYNIVGKSALSNKEKQYAIDFVAIKNGKKCFIQVSYLLASKETIEREFGAYSKITDASPKYVMSLDKIDMSHDGIIHVNIIDFLLRRVDLILT
ncbi:MAG: hypothetical protein MR304_00370 [Eubacterium sp.]|nr:hypothetical protein [Eubacterium sp.]